MTGKLKRNKILLDEKDKLLDNYYLLNHWLEIKNLGKSVSMYFEWKGYKNIAIYGMAELANRLMEDLEDSPIRVIYGVDRDVSCTISQIRDVYDISEELPKADVIVVTPFYAYENIKHQLEKKVNYPIVSLEEVVWSV